jgi:hypothetical protein
MSCDSTNKSGNILRERFCSLDTEQVFTVLLNVYIVNMSYSERDGKGRGFIYIRKFASFSVLDDAFQPPRLCSTISVPLSPAYLLRISKQLSTKRCTLSGSYLPAMSK